MMELSHLYRYPVKSMQGESLNRMQLDALGPMGDRRWMLVNEQGRFLSQREWPRMALVLPHLDAEGLVLEVPGREPVTVNEPDGERLQVKIWQDSCEAIAPSTEADAWLSDFLGVACRLVRFPPDQMRQVDQNYAQPGDQTAFSDGFPLLLISQASLDDLNQRMARPLPMIRFRPNLVISGCEPYAEDHWQRIRIGGLEFSVVKPCSRCVIPTIDPERGERDGNEPLKTLMSYRKQGNKVFFGQNLIHRGQGELHTGMDVEVLE